MKALSCIADCAITSSGSDVVPAHVVVVTGFIPAHRLPVYVELSRRVKKLTILLSTPMEPNRNWKPQWGALDVRVQRTWTLERPRRHVLGFKDTTFVHIPWDTTAWLRKLRPDVVVSAELGFRSLFSALYRKMSRRTPLILWTGLSEHTEKGKGPMRHVLRRWLLRQADGVVVNGNSGATYLQRMGVSAERIFRIRYSCLPNLFDRGPATRPPEAANRLLFVGRLVELKGLIPFMEALARWAVAHPDRTVEFTIAGSGPLQPQIESFPVPENVAVRLAGECDYARLADLYDEAGVFVFPTLADDWGISVNEAMTSGLPVLGSVYSQAVAEMCTDGKTGWTYRTNVPHELDGAIEAALSTRQEKLDEMRQKARARVAWRTPVLGAEDVIRAIRAAIGGRGTDPRTEHHNRSPQMDSYVPRVSIGLPVYNGEKYVAEAIESLLGQTFEDFEVVISDNASTDATEEICRGFAARDRRVRYFRQEVNLGPAWNFNRVFELATGEYFKWVAHDDLCAPTYLARCVEVLDKDLSVILCYPRAAVIDENGQLVGEEGFSHWPEPDDPKAPHLHDHGHPRHLDSPRPSKRYFGILVLSTRCYEIFGLIRTSAMRKTGLHGTYCGAEKVLLTELSLAGRFAEIPETLFLSRWHSRRFSSRGSRLEQLRHFNPGSTRKFVLPRQVRCSWGYFNAIRKADVKWCEKAMCCVALARYFLQVRKWKCVLTNAIRGRDTTAMIPADAKRVGRPVVLAAREAPSRQPGCYSLEGK